MGWPYVSVLPARKMEVIIVRDKQSYLQFELTLLKLGRWWLQARFLSPFLCFRNVHRWKLHSCPGQLGFFAIYSEVLLFLLFLLPFVLLLYVTGETGSVILITLGKLSRRYRMAAVTVLQNHFFRLFPGLFSQPLTTLVSLHQNSFVYLCLPYFEWGQGEGC